MGLLFVVGCTALARAARMEIQTEGHAASDQVAPNYGAIAAATRAARERKLKHMKEVNELWDQMHDTWLAVFQSAVDLLPQPSEVFNVHKCLPRGQFVQTDLKNVTSPVQYFWFPTKQDSGTTDVVLRGGPLMTDSNKETLLAEVGTVKRGECCGENAKWIHVDKTDSGIDFYGYRSVYAKLQCLGADLGQPCRLRNVIGMIFSSSSCRDGLKCTKLEGGDEGIGECKA